MPSHPILLIDIDGLRPDVFQRLLEAGRLPNFARLFGSQGLPQGWLSPVLAPAPSITFASQASLFTGAHPAVHGITGNQFFDRFGLSNGGKPRMYAFDVGDTLGMDDAVEVFSNGLASHYLQAPTLYEQLSGRLGKTVVVGHMISRGAGEWLPPSVINLARLTKGGSLFGLDAADFDRRTLKNALDYLDKNGLPGLLTVYFMGVDHESHRHGPQAQGTYLADVLDGLVGELWDAIEQSHTAGEPILVAVFSDHGQIAVPADDRHSLRLAFPFERELLPLFDALGRDVNDKPKEGALTDAVVASNGGIAQVYLRPIDSAWDTPPDFDLDVLPVGRTFWEAHEHGRYTPDLEGALSAVLVRCEEQEGWGSSYRALTPQGDLLSLEDWFNAQPAGLYVDPVHRSSNLAGKTSGDLLVLSDYSRGFYFAAPVAGVHGGLHPDDSFATLAIGLPGAEKASLEQTRRHFEGAVSDRCRAEGGRQPSTADLVPGLLAVIAGW